MSQAMCGVVGKRRPRDIEDDIGGRVQASEAKQSRPGLAFCDASAVGRICWEVKE